MSASPTNLPQISPRRPATNNGVVPASEVGSSSAAIVASFPTATTANNTNSSSPRVAPPPPIHSGSSGAIFTSSLRRAHKGAAARHDAALASMGRAVVSAGTISDPFSNVGIHGSLSKWPSPHQCSALSTADIGDEAVEGCSGGGGDTKDTDAASLTTLSPRSGQIAAGTKGSSSRSGSNMPSLAAKLEDLIRKHNDRLASTINDAAAAAGATEPPSSDANNSMLHHNGTSGHVGATSSSLPHMPHHAVLFARQLALCRNVCAVMGAHFRPYRHVMQAVVDAAEGMSDIYRSLGDSVALIESNGDAIDAEHKTRVAALEGTIAALQTEVARLSDTERALGTIASLEEEKASLSIRFEESEKKHRKLKAALSEMHEKYSLLQHRHVLVTGSDERHRTKGERLEEDIKALELQVKLISFERDESQRKHDRMDAELVDTKKRVERMAAQIKTFEERLILVTEENSLLKYERSRMQRAGLWHAGGAGASTSTFGGGGGGSLSTAAGGGGRSSEASISTNGILPFGLGMGAGGEGPLAGGDHYHYAAAGNGVSPPQTPGSTSPRHGRAGGVATGSPMLMGSPSSPPQQRFARAPTPRPEWHGYAQVMGEGRLLLGTGDANAPAHLFTSADALLRRLTMGRADGGAEGSGREGGNETLSALLEALDGPAGDGANNATNSNGTGGSSSSSDKAHAVLSHAAAAHGYIRELKGTVKALLARIADLQQFHGNALGLGADGMEGCRAAAEAQLKALTAELAVAQQHNQMLLLNSSSAANARQQGGNGQQGSGDHAGGPLSRRKSSGGGLSPRVKRGSIAKPSTPSMSSASMSPASPAANDGALFRNNNSNANHGDSNSGTADVALMGSSADVCGNGNGQQRHRTTTIVVGSPSAATTAAAVPPLAPSPPAARRRSASVPTHGNGSATAPLAVDVNPHLVGAITQHLITAAPCSSAAPAVGGGASVAGLISHMFWSPHAVSSAAALPSVSAPPSNMSRKGLGASSLIGGVPMASPLVTAVSSLQAAPATILVANRLLPMLQRATSAKAPSAPRTHHSGNAALESAAAFSPQPMPSSSPMPLPPPLQSGGSAAAVPSFADSLTKALYDQWQQQRRVLLAMAQQVPPSDAPMAAAKGGAPKEKGMSRGDSKAAAQALALANANPFTTTLSLAGQGSGRVPLCLEASTARTLLEVLRPNDALSQRSDPNGADTSPTSSCLPLPMPTLDSVLVLVQKGLLRHHLLAEATIVGPSISSSPSPPSPRGGGGGGNADTVGGKSPNSSPLRSAIGGAARQYLMPRAADLPQSAAAPSGPLGNINDADPIAALQPRADLSHVADGARALERGLQTAFGGGGASAGGGQPNAGGGRTKKSGRRHAAVSSGASSSSQSYLEEAGYQTYQSTMHLCGTSIAAMTSCHALEYGALFMPVGVLVDVYEACYDYVAMRQRVAMNGKGAVLNFNPSTVPSALVLPQQQQQHSAPSAASATAPPSTANASSSAIPYWETEAVNKTIAVMKAVNSNPLLSCTTAMGAGGAAAVGRGSSPSSKGSTTAAAQKGQGGADGADPSTASSGGGGCGIGYLYDTSFVEDFINCVATCLLPKFRATVALGKAHDGALGRLSKAAAGPIVDALAASAGGGGNAAQPGTSAQGTSASIVGNGGNRSSSSPPKKGGGSSGAARAVKGVVAGNLADGGGAANAAGGANTALSAAQSLLGVGGGAAALMAGDLFASSVNASLPPTATCTGASSLYYDASSALAGTADGSSVVNGGDALSAAGGGASTAIPSHNPSAVTLEAIVYSVLYHSHRVQHRLPAARLFLAHMAAAVPKTAFMGVRRVVHTVAHRVAERTGLSMIAEVTLPLTGSSTTSTTAKASTKGGGDGNGSSSNNGGGPTAPSPISSGLYRAHLAGLVAAAVGAGGGVGNASTAGGGGNAAASSSFHPISPSSSPASLPPQSQSQSSSCPSLTDLVAILSEDLPMFGDGQLRMLHEALLSDPSLVTALLEGVGPQHYVYTAAPAALHHGGDTNRQQMGSVMGPALCDSLIPCPPPMRVSSGAAEGEPFGDGAPLSPLALHPHSADPSSPYLLDPFYQCVNGAYRHAHAVQYGLVSAVGRGGLRVPERGLAREGATQSTVEGSMAAMMAAASRGAKNSPTRDRAGGGDGGAAAVLPQQSSPSPWLVSLRPNLSTPTSGLVQTITSIVLHHQLISTCAMQASLRDVVTMSTSSGRGVGTPLATSTSNAPPSALAASSTANFNSTGVFGRPTPHPTGGASSLPLPPPPSASGSSSSSSSLLRPLGFYRSSECVSVLNVQQAMEKGDPIGAMRQPEALRRLVAELCCGNPHAELPPRQKVSVREVSLRLPLVHYMRLTPTAFPPAGGPLAGTGKGAASSGGGGLVSTVFETSPTRNTATSSSASAASATAAAGSSFAIGRFATYAGALKHYAGNPSAAYADAMGGDTTAAPSTGAPSVSSRANNQPAATTMLGDCDHACLQVRFVGSRLGVLTSIALSSPPPPTSSGAVLPPSTISSPTTSAAGGSVFGARAVATPPAHAEA